MNRKKVTSCFSIDVRRFAREGWLIPDTKFEWVWRDKSGRERAAMTVVVRREALVLAYILQSGHRPKCVRGLVPFVWSTGPQGRRRRWFCCPGCTGRVAILFMAEQDFRCRRCSGLVYESQYRYRERSYGRRHRVIGPL